MTEAELADALADLAAIRDKPFSLESITTTHRIIEGIARSAAKTQQKYGSALREIKRLHEAISRIGAVPIRHGHRCPRMAQAALSEGDFDFLK